jgi:hypothetical protein
MKFKNLFQTPEAIELAAKELAEAKRQLLSTLSAKEYATQLAEYHAQRIQRLEAYIKDQAK